VPEGETAAGVKRFRAGVFGRGAADYDQIGDPILAEMGRRLVALARVEAGQSVLDVATGRGAVLFPAADAVGEGGRVVGIDLAPQMVELTRSEVERRRLSQVEVRIADAEDLRDFSDGEFDVVTCAFAIFFLPHPDRALREFARVLRRGGTVALASWGAADARYAWFREVREELGIARVETETQPFDTAAELVGALEAAGLVDVATAAERVVFRPGGPEDWWRWLMTGASRATIEALEPEDRRRFRDACFARIREVYEDAQVELDEDALFATARRP
jgi:ubiquinone/menaquinone biosynthesis C-methylase UbiE